MKMLKTTQFHPISYLITYSQALLEVIWLVRQEKLKDKCFEKIFLKKCKFYQKIFKIWKVKLLKTNPLKLATMH